MTGRYLVLVVVILMMACISYGQQRSSKMKPPLIGEESSGQKRRTAGTLKNSNRSLRLEREKKGGQHTYQSHRVSPHKTRNKKKKK